MFDTTYDPQLIDKMIKGSLRLGDRDTTEIAISNLKEFFFLPPYPASRASQSQVVKGLPLKINLHQRQGHNLGIAEIKLGEVLNMINHVQSHRLKH